MPRILGKRWWSTARATIGAVAVEIEWEGKTYGWKVYIGVGAGYDEVTDAQSIAANGAKMLEHEARAIFPNAPALPYLP